VVAHGQFLSHQRTPLECLNLVFHCKSTRYELAR
jgi:hypothetical protein